jgi:hypothetical protein
MKNFNLFMNEKKEKLKIAGSIVGGVTIIALSSCNVSNVKNDSSSVETSILSSVSTTTISNNNTSSYSTTSNKTQTTTKETTTQTTTTSTTTKAPETIPTTTNEVIITPSPVTTNIPATEKPGEATTKVTTKVTQTTTKKEEPIEYETRTDEIKGYYSNVKLNNTSKLTKQNINNYEDFISVASIRPNAYFYEVYFNLDSNKKESTITDGYLEKIIFLTLLNEKYINDDTLKKILKPYSREELSYVVDNSIVVFNRNLYEHIDYNFSNITVDKTLCNLLTSIQNAYKKNDYKTVEKLCNQNYKKYNDFVDLLLLMYEYNMPEISEYITNENSLDLSLQLVDKTGIYDRAHQKVLVKQ